MRGAWGALVLCAACAAGKFHEQMEIDGRRFQEGMSADDLEKAIGPPDFVSKTGHRFAYEFRDTGKAIEPSWEEWVWFEEPYTYVAYVSGGAVWRIGVITDSPPPPTDEGFGLFCQRPSRTSTRVSSPAFSSTSRRSVANPFASIVTLSGPGGSHGFRILPSASARFAPHEAGS